MLLQQRGLQGLHAGDVADVLHEHKHQRCLGAQARIIRGPALEEAAGTLLGEEICCAGEGVGVLAAIAVHVRLHHVYRLCDGGCCQPCNDATHL